MRNVLGALGSGEFGGRACVLHGESDVGEEGEVESGDNVEVHGVACHAENLSGAVGPAPAVRGDSLSAEGFMLSHESASSKQPESVASGGSEAWYVWGAGGYVVFSGDFSPREENGSGPAFDVDDAFLAVAVNADVVESSEFASGVSGGEVFLAFDAER